MQLTNRDKVLVWVIPAVSIVVGYGLWINGVYGLSMLPGAGKQTDLTRLQKQVSDAAKTAPAEEEVQKQKAHQMSLAFKAHQLETDLAQVKKRWEASVGQAFNPATRNDRVAGINAVLAGHGLMLLGDAPAEGGAAMENTSAVSYRRGGVAVQAADDWAVSGEAGAAAKVSPSLEAFAKAVTERSPQLKPRMWRIRLFGRYTDLAQALDQLSGGDALCVPVGLTMDHWDVNNRGQEWTLLIWI